MSCAKQHSHVHPDDQHEIINPAKVADQTAKAPGTAGRSKEVLYRFTIELFILMFKQQMADEAEGIVTEETLESMQVCTCI
jgi:hypothetical protein